MALRSRSTVACFRAVVDCRSAASCASEGTRAAAGFRPLARIFMVLLSFAMWRWQDLVEWDVATSGLLFKLHLHDVNHVIKVLHLDTGFSCVNSVALSLQDLSLLLICCSPSQSCSELLRIFDMIAASQTECPVGSSRAESWTTTIAQSSRMKRMPYLVNRLQIRIFLL